MMQITPKWKVSVTFPDREIVFWISETFPSNALRKVADIEFTESGIEIPQRISVEAVYEKMHVYAGNETASEFTASQGRK